MELLYGIPCNLWSTVCRSIICWSLFGLVLVTFRYVWFLFFVLQSGVVWFGSGYVWFRLVSVLRPPTQVYDSFFSSRRMVGMVASLEAVQLTW